MYELRNEVRLKCGVGRLRTHVPVREPTFRVAQSKATLVRSVDRPDGFHRDYGLPRAASTEWEKTVVRPRDIGLAGKGGRKIVTGLGGRSAI